MDVLVSLEHRFFKTRDGFVWTIDQFDYAFWNRYLDVFDNVYPIARIQCLNYVSSDLKHADGPRVTFKEIPYYIGPVQYLRLHRQIKAKIKTIFCSNSDAVIMRVGSQIANLIIPLLKHNFHPFAIEVVGDPYDVFSPGAVRHPLRPIFRWWFSRQLRFQCKQACAVSYVTQKALQIRYPPTSKAFSSYYSDVELNNNAFVTNAKKYSMKTKIKKIIFIGSLDQLYKAPDILIHAIHCCLKEGIDVFLTMVGDGRFRPEIESLSRKLNLLDRIRFLGQMTAGEAVRAELDKADLFVLPSKTEGLPRAMIEAMARGLPCIGSNVGGIPELLPPEDMVPPGDVQALASKIKEVIRDPERMNRMAERNWKKAHEYHDDNLRERRNAFYRYVKEKTEEWQRQQGLR